MITFFRSIRQNLLNENKTAKYLKYAAGEIVLVIIGILIALQINTWNQNRLLRNEETEIISRILVDINADIKSLETRLGFLEEKEESLLRVKKTFIEGEARNSKSFLEDAITGTQFGWSQAGGNRSTYDDLLGSGKLGIIEDFEVRTAISSYYTQYQTTSDRIASRETDYPNLTYDYIPRNAGPGGHWIPEASLSEEEANDLVSQILNSSILNKVTAEINFGRFTHTVSLGLFERARQLEEVLKTYQMEI